MNHVIELNKQKYIVRRQPQKLMLLSFPDLKLLHKCYLNTSFSYLNKNTGEFMSIYQNQIAILKVVIAPLQIAIIQQSFIDWQPLGGILMESNVVLYGIHGIVFYTRGNIMEKTWQIDVLQRIEEIKVNPNDELIAMKVKDPSNSLFLWHLAEPSVKPTQEIILTQPIIQWEFIRKDLLVILTSSQLRIYIQGAQNQFNLYHFYLLNARAFCWVDYPWTSKPNRVSVNSLILMQKKGVASVLELYGIQKRILLSEAEKIGSIVLKYKSVNMKRVIGCWKQGDRIGLICETKHRDLFSFLISKTLEVQFSKAYEECLGADLNQVYANRNLVLVKDKHRWKYYKIINQGAFQLLEELDCEKAFIGSEDKVYYLYDQALYVKSIGGERSDPLPFKYPKASKVHFLCQQNESTFLIAGIRFIKIFEGKVESAGIAIKQERAELISVDRMTQSLTYKMGEQTILLNYKISMKGSTTIVKSSTKDLIGVKGGRWIELDQNEFSLGEGDKVLTVFSISKLLKILDNENKLFHYDLHSINQSGLILILKNYAFFLQIVEDEKGCEIVMIKRQNTVLYNRFNPHAHTIKLIDPFSLTFWVGNTVIQLGSKINPHAIVDPFQLPQTLMAKQLELKRVFPPHHPRFIQLLIETNNLTLLLELLKIIRSWMGKQHHNVAELYKDFRVDFVLDVLWGSREEDLSRWSEQRALEESEFVAKLASQILESIEQIKLKQKNPFILESILQSLAYYLSNTRTVDFFSQGALILSKSAVLKGKPLRSMHVALMMHSLNKEEAAAYLKPENMSWDWLKDYSIPFWIDNRQQLKKWIEEIAMQEYRKNKEPFDCLFWYLLIGKKTLLITLFKNHRMNSKEHEAIYNFLQRDFTDAKNRSAAVKNAYVLIDKKRYLHSLAFFILGQSIDDCVRLCADRLKDLNLTYTFILFFREASNEYLFGQMRKGDIWMKHITCKLSGQHILSYNCLFEESDDSSWPYHPALTGFHPIVIEFAQKIKNSVPVKREIELQNYESQTSQDIFADFFGSSEPAAQEPKKKKTELKGDIDDLKPLAIRYYIKEGAPVMALSLQESNQEAKLGYSFQLYKLGNEVRPEMESVVVGLEDKLAIAKCMKANQKDKELYNYLCNEIETFKSNLQLVEMVEILRTKKHVLGEILHFGFFMEKIWLFLKSCQGFGEMTKEFDKIILELGQMSKLSQVFSCLILDDYETLIPVIEEINHIELVPSPEIWEKFKNKYDEVIETKKAKQLKQMDYFEHAFISTYRAIKREAIYRPDLEITSEEGAYLILRLLVLRYLTKKEIPLLAELHKIKNSIQEYLNNWLPSFKLSNLFDEFRVLLKEGTQAKLKLTTLGQVFDNSFNQFFDLVMDIHLGYFEKHQLSVFDDKPKELQAIEVFRNKADGLKSFIINKHEGKGLQCIVLLKKLIKKFQVCQNLVKRERTKDSYSLLTDDASFNNMSNSDPETYLKSKQPPLIEQALNQVINQRKYLNTREFPRGCTAHSESSYIRHVEAPYLDHNQLNSIQCHPFLPFFMIGGKGVIQVAHLNSMKNFDRVRCPGMAEIVKVHSCGQRIGAIDNLGNLGIYTFDPAFHNSCVYAMKKASAIDFCYLNPSVIAMISPLAVSVYDTLIHPKRQMKFKQSFSKDPIAISSTKDNKIIVLRKNEVLIYDIRMQRLERSRELKTKAKSLYLDDSLLYIGQAESKVKVFDINSQNGGSEIIRVGSGDERERERYAIDQISGYDDVVLALSSEGSIYYLPSVNKESLK